MEGLSERAARGVALATLAVACVVVGPAPRLLDSFERTFVVALAEHRQRTQRPTHRIPGVSLGRWRPAGSRPPHLRP
jgi:hypothetical protein